MQTHRLNGTSVLSYKMTFSKYGTTQDTHCLYKKALRSICVPTVVVEKQYVRALNIISVRLYTWLSYLACISHIFSIALYCHLWPVWLYHNFHIISLKARFSEKNVMNIKCGFYLLYNFGQEHFSFWKEFSEVS